MTPQYWTGPVPSPSLSLLVGFVPFLSLASRLPEGTGMDDGAVYESALFVRRCASTKPSEKAVTYHQPQDHTSRSEHIHQSSPGPPAAPSQLGHDAMGGFTFCTWLRSCSKGGAAAFMQRGWITRFLLGSRKGEDLSLSGRPANLTGPVRLSITMQHPIPSPHSALLLVLSVKKKIGTPQ
ncbi:hypothetical protein V8C40DRAFT_235717 [Trichoderma camerunense]